MLDKIEKGRITKKESVKQFCDSSGVPEATYNNVIHGRSKNPSYNTIYRMAVAAGLRTGDFVPITFASGFADTPVESQTENPSPVNSADLTALSDTFTNAITRRDDAYRQALAALTAQHEAALVKLNQQHDIELTRLSDRKDAAQQQALAALAAQHEFVLNTLEQRHTAETLHLMEIIRSKRRAAFWAVTACCILSAALILLIAVDIIAMTA